jgi:outer membrane immunogenic protein
MSRIHLLTVAFTLTAALVSSPARASDSYDWTGFYVGANSGFAWGDSDVEVTTPWVPGGYFLFSSTQSINGIGERKLEPSGYTGGIQAGFDWQMGNPVLGIETDVEYFDQEDEDDSFRAYPCCPIDGYQVKNKVETDWLYTLRGKVGFALDRILVFASGGLAVTEIEDEFRFRDTFGARESGSISEIKAGWAVGGGLEYGLLESVSVRVEYLHVDFRRESETEHNFFEGGSFPLTRMKHSVDLSSEIARVAVNFRF